MSLYKSRAKANDAQVASGRRAGRPLAAIIVLRSNHEVQNASRSDNRRINRHRVGAVIRLDTAASGGEVLGRLGANRVIIDL